MSGIWLLAGAGVDVRCARLRRRDAHVELSRSRRRRGWSQYRAILGLRSTALAHGVTEKLWESAGSRNGKLGRGR